MITWCLCFGSNQTMAFCRWSHWRRGSLTAMKESISWSIGSITELLLFIGFQVSSSLRPSWQVRCKTTLERELSLLTESVSVTMWKITWQKRRSRKSLRSDASFTVATWKDVSGITTRTCLTKVIQKSSSWRCQWSTWCQLKTVSSSRQASTELRCTKCCPEQELCQRLVTQQTS